MSSATRKKQPEPETVRKLAEMIPNMEDTKDNQQLLMLCGIALGNPTFVTQACDAGARGSSPVSDRNMNIMNQLGYFLEEM